MTHEQPSIGESLKCMICALEKPWGVLDAKTGAAVCKDCRDAARRETPKKSDAITRIAEAIAHRRGMRRGAPIVSNIFDLLPSAIREDLLDDATGVYESLFPAA